MKKLFCWRCKAEIPKLDEDEWSMLVKVLEDCTSNTRNNRHDRGIFGPALEEYERITGFRETNPNALWHHRLSLYGPPCHNCGKPLRTPQAKLCGACMAPRQKV